MLTELILADREWWQVFEWAAAEGQIGLPERAGKLAGALQERGFAGGLPTHVLRDAVEALIPELALELLPESPAAAWERLLAKVREDAVTYEGPSGAIQRLAAADRRIFCGLAHLALVEPDQATLVAVAREVWVELSRRGHDYESRGFSDFVWLAIREAFPGLPGTAWDGNWAAYIYRELLRDLVRVASEAGVEAAEVDTRSLDEAMNEMAAAEEAEDPVAFRQAARRAIKAGRCAVREAASTNP